MLFPEMLVVTYLMPELGQNRDRFEKDANLKFSSDKQFWVDFLAGNIDVDKIVKEYSGD